MNTVISGFKTTVGIIATALNQPIAKEGIKKVASVAHFGLGLVAIYDIAQILRGRFISTQKSTSPVDSSKSTLEKTILVSAKIALVLGGLSSQPGVFLVSTALGAVFSNAQLENVFGANTTFVVNPLHPRHVCSIAATILAAPAAAQAISQGATWVARNIAALAATKNEAVSANKTTIKVTPPGLWLDDAKTRISALFTEITGRPFLHGCNWLIGRLTIA